VTSILAADEAQICFSFSCFPATSIISNVIPNFSACLPIAGAVDINTTRRHPIDFAISGLAIFNPLKYGKLAIEIIAENIK
jgi:hypothetical protein